MDASFEIRFPDEKTARQALKVAPPKTGPKASLTAKISPTNKKTVRYSITAESFTALRAHSTSLLRDLKVFLDTVEFTRNK